MGIPAPLSGLQNALLFSYSFCFLAFRFRVFLLLTLCSLSFNKDLRFIQNVLPTKQSISPSNCQTILSQIHQYLKYHHNNLTAGIILITSAPTCNSANPMCGHIEHRIIITIHSVFRIGSHPLFCMVIDDIFCYLTTQFALSIGSKPEFCMVIYDAFTI